MAQVADDLTVMFRERGEERKSIVGMTVGIGRRGGGGGSGAWRR